VRLLGAGPGGRPPGPPRDHAGRLAALSLLYLDVGNRDEYAMHWGVRALHAALDACGVTHIYREHAGGHHGIEYMFVDAMAELSRVWPTEPEAGACAG
jgi:hypothetical protein